MAEIKISVSAENRTDETLSAIESAFASVFSAIEDRVSTAGLKISETLMGLDSLLAEQRTLTIDTSGALSGLSMIRDSMVEILGLESRIESISTGGGASRASSNEFQWDYSFLPSYDTGTPYVPSTGLAMVHKGERIIPAEENGGMSSSASPGSTSISLSFGDIIIPESAKDVDRIADQLVLKVREKLARIEARK